MRSDDKGLPPWVWVGCGCVGAIGALIAIAVGLGFWGVQKARELEDTMRNPEERTEKALEVLGAEQLPEGYHAVLALSGPFGFGFAVLADRPPRDDGTPADVAETGFFFMSYPNIGEGDEELYDFFEGRTDDVDALRRENINLDLEERVDIGRIEREQDALLWVAHRGRVHAAQVENEHDGLVTLTLFECGDDRRRMGIWFGPDPAPEADVAELSVEGTVTDPAELSLEGTVADPAELEKFLAPLRPCS